MHEKKEAYVLFITTNEVIRSSIVLLTVSSQHVHRPSKLKEPDVTDSTSLLTTPDGVQSQPVSDAAVGLAGAWINTTINQCIKKSCIKKSYIVA